MEDNNFIFLYCFIGLESFLGYFQYFLARILYHLCYMEDNNFIFILYCFIEDQTM